MERASSTERRGRAVSQGVRLPPEMIFSRPNTKRRDAIKCMSGLLSRPSMPELCCISAKHKAQMARRGVTGVTITEWD